MRRLVVVAKRNDSSVNKFPAESLREARNLRDFLEETRDYSTVSIYELEQTMGPMQQWTELPEILP